MGGESTAPLGGFIYHSGTAAVTNNVDVVSSSGADTTQSISSIQSNANKVSVHSQLLTHLVDLLVYTKQLQLSLSNIACDIHVTLVGLRLKSYSGNSS